LEPQQRVSFHSWIGTALLLHFLEPTHLEVGQLNGGLRPPAFLWVILELIVYDQWTLAALGVGMLLILYVAFFWR